jgi:4-carboxymuconolactone decarboxylase
VSAASGVRLQKLSPEELDADQRAVYEAIAGGPRATGPQLFRLRDDHGGLEGPFNAFLLQPRLGGPLESLGSAVRYQTGLPDRAREVAILVVAALEDSGFERYAHEPLGASVGLSDEELRGIRQLSFDALPESERLIAELTETLIREGDLDENGYAAAVDILGEAGIFELTTLVGYYRTLALQLRVFRVGVPED